MKIGYSFWGFLGEGIVDTPDGGRGHRLTWLRELSRRGHSVILLQKNRDRFEAADPSFGSEFVWASEDFPQIDVLFLEWRWPIPGRNIGNACGDPFHTCDLHRQQELLDHYTSGLRTPTLIWDKDLRVEPESQLRNFSNVRVAETAWFPRANAIRLQIPVSLEEIQSANADLATSDRHMRNLALVYVGNQYERDARFNEYFAVPAATEARHSVIGKWSDTSNWPWVNFLGRKSFSTSMAVYREALATVALFPPRYEAVGQTTQRIAEAVLRGCVPLVPDSVRGANQCTPPELIVGTGRDVSERLQDLERLSPEAYLDLRRRCVELLDALRADRQYENLADSCEWFAV